MIEEGASIRRRRECLGCAKRFTTFERVEDIRLLVLKRSGQRELFDRTKIIKGVEAALKNRPFGEQEIAEMVSELEEELRAIGDEVPSSEIGLRLLDRLHLLDEVGYFRFASVYKGFEEWADFEREATSLPGRALDKSGDKNEGRPEVG